MEVKPLNKQDWRHFSPSCRERLQKLFWKDLLPLKEYTIFSKDFPKRFPKKHPREHTKGRYEEPSNEPTKTSKKPLKEPIRNNISPECSAMVTGFCLISKWELPFWTFYVQTEIWKQIFQKDFIQPPNGKLTICKLPFPSGSYRVCRALWARTLRNPEE